MDADKESAYIGIEISHPDIDIHQRLFNQLKLMLDMLENETGEEWEWSEAETIDTGKTISRVYQQIDGVNIFRQEQWPDIISFLKPRIIALDIFWTDAKEIFEMIS